MKQLKPTYLFPAIARYHEIKAKCVLARSGDGIAKQTLSENWITPFICCKEQIWTMPIQGFSDPVRIKAFYAKDGSYIGDEKTVEFLMGRDIQPQRAKPDYDVSSIGWSPRDEKWYGWSHRAIHGFKIGDEYHQSGQCVPFDPVPPSGRIITTLNEAKESAINFAEDVS